MPTGRESVCCKEIPEVARRMTKVGVQCYTDNRGFNSICLDEDCIEMSLLHYVQDVIPVDDNEPIHR